jgi:NAD(P)-dependent dehydrogenase (short-subunit alcohol dehydrogenase family)
MTTKTALVTGGSAGLGLALIRSLHNLGWQIVTDARDGRRLDAAVADLGEVITVAGDISDPDHRTALLEEVRRLGGLDLLVNNASTLGPTPLRPLGWLTSEELAEIWAVNAAAPVALTTLLLLQFREGALIVSISSDAAIEHYDTWGGYGASKAALDHFTLTLGVETGLRAYAVDPGDMRTAMHQAAFPGEDISDRPLPESVVPRLLDLIADPPAPGRYRLAELAKQARRGA